MTHTLDGPSDLHIPARGCDPQSRAQRSGCSKLSPPGVPSGGCAFDGAKVVLQPIADTAHLVHGPLACEGNGWDTRTSASSGAQLYRSGFTTDLTEVHITMGQGEQRLLASLQQIIEKHAPEAVFVYTTCVTALIGDDVAAVCKDASERFGVPCIEVPAPGFLGTRNLGNRIAGELLFDRVIGTREPDVVTDTDINILGEFNLRGELWQVLPLFEELGIRVHACITGDARFQQVASCHRARVNMVVCSAALINLAVRMQERYDIPYFEGSFYGLANTSAALRQVARLLVARGADPQLIERTEVLITREETRAQLRIAPHRQRLTGKRVLLHTGGYKTWSLIGAFHEIGLHVRGTMLRKATPEDKRRARAVLPPDACTYETPPERGLRARLDELPVDLLVSGGRWQFIAHGAGTAFLDINQGRHHAYAGYEGLVTLAEQADFAINSPVWASTRAPAPWDAAVSDADLALSAE
ncbi:MAG: nitrogenase iron-molybdenum cofactor biosynthesis protein NifE [Polyangiales bacterium]